tara:strand:+ start:461 stop:1201 length:741 start_codon:yes stop_codon:yes gene_type:complete
MKLTPLLAALVVTSAAFSQAENYPEPLMVVPGDIIVSKTFDTEEDIDKATFSFRKEAHHEIADGILKVIPPVVAYEGTQTDTQWASSSVSRAGLVGLPQEFVCQFRWKYLKPTDPKALSKRSVYIDLGHRCIRTTLNGEGATLKLENHLVGKEAEETSKVLVTENKLTLDPDKWYDITIEVKGDEVIYQIDGHTLYGQDDLIAKERANTFNLDSGGVGYLIDEIVIREAGEFLPDWADKRASYQKN